jgi:hypothetical protein
MMNRVSLRLALVLSLTLLALSGARRASAADQQVSDCGDSGLQTQLRFQLILAQERDNSTIAFTCTTPVVLTAGVLPSINLNVTIDGGNSIILSGNNGSRLFEVASGGNLTLKNITIAKGHADGDGGAISNNGTLTLENSIMRDSEAGASGGAIVSYGRLTIINSLLEGNRALNGGALYPRWSGAQTTITNSVLRNNYATDKTNGWGGAILAWDGAPVTIERSDIAGNLARIGGGIYNFANSVLTLRSSTRLRDNVATISGGGLWNDGTATLTNATLSGNQATDGVGGGLYNGGTATLSDVTLSGNQATNRDGGGLWNHGTATLTNVTISGNSAIHGLGGGIYNDSDGPVAMLTNVTINGNSAFAGGGISRGSLSYVEVKNTLVANSPSGRNCTGGVTNNGFNLSSDASCGFGSGRDNVTVLLGPLANNGGPTLTHMPQTGSPAIDHGSGCSATDQRGAARPAGLACDIGAVEYGARLPSVYVPIVRK